MLEKRVKSGLAVTPRHLKLCDDNLRRAGVSSRNDFVEQAIEFYCSHLLSHELAQLRSRGEVPMERFETLSKSLTKLIPSLLTMVDEEKLSVSTAADYISVLTEDEQIDLASVMDKLGVIPVKGQLAKIKEQSKAGTLTITVIEAILSEGRPATVQVVLKQARLSQFFPQTYTAQQMEEVIVSLLEAWSVQQK